jgi:hypothetical protein
MDKTEIEILLASVEKPRKKRKPYWKPEAVRELEQMDFEFRYRDSILPDHVRSYNRFRDDTANGLTKCILAYLKLHGAFASRINTTGIYRNDIKKFVPNTQKKGLADISATYRGVSIQIEVKVGRDKMSASQLQVKSDFEKSGGYWYTARNFTDFKNWFDKVLENNKKFQKYGTS